MSYISQLDREKKTLIVVIGPTGVGKTAVAIQLAQRFDTEVISADSRQIFKEMTIGTAKPTLEELKMVPHHFINTHSITDDYDAAAYGRDALALISQRFQEHDILILCGGSGLYVKGVVEGFDDIPEVSADIRERLMQHYERYGLEWLQREMQKLDPGHFSIIDQKNPHRLIRALEVRIGTGSSIASFRKQSKMHHDFEIVRIGLELPREQLYQRIDERMDRMIDRGLFEEASGLYQYRDRQALQTVGYQEIFDFMDHKYNREEAIRLLKRNSRRYAKRQLTWFKRDRDVTWFSPEEPEAIFEFIKQLKAVPDGNHNVI